MIQLIMYHGDICFLSSSFNLLYALAAPLRGTITPTYHILSTFSWWDSLRQTPSSYVRLQEFYEFTKR